ncbi:MAG: RimK family alpha-L-glutamate ligase [Fuerstiella sp.]|nr:RimK family alpha-L-glutamate ligase [Fuerstiella sp.]MCP4853843.1 RimK family alpha-L-glutamate ligase [Fuerstiella sp.]
MRIGVLGNEGSWYVDQICSAATSAGHEALSLQFQQLRAGVSDNISHLHIGDVDVTGLDAIIVRTMPPGSLEQVVCRMDFLAAVAATGARIINDPKAIECAVDKYLTTQKLASAGIRVPDTTVCEDSNAALVAFEQLGGDVVVKPLFGAEGRGIMRVDHPELALRTFRTLERLQATIYLQRFNQGPLTDIRILLLDGKIVGCMKRSPSNGDFRANAAQDAVCQAWQPTRVERELALQAANVTGCVFSGVDLMYNEHQQPVVIEVNAVPGWKALEKTCDVDVPQTLIRWLEDSHQDNVHTIINRSGS